MLKLKKNYFFILSAALFLFAAFLFTPRDVSAAESVNEYRLYNPVSETHLYTQDVKERNSLIQSGWTYEGRSWMNSQKTNIPVYRLSTPDAKDRFYTASEKEKDFLMKAGWKYEGIDSYALGKSSTPVYRLYSKKNGRHIYTADKNERDSLKRDGWDLEGIGWYTLSSVRPYDVSPQNTYVYVTANKLNVRSEPHVSADKTGFYSYRQKVHVTGTYKENGWLRTNAGFISSKFVSSRRPVLKKTYVYQASSASQSVSSAPSSVSSQTQVQTSSGESGVSYVWNTTAYGNSQAAVDAGHFITWMPDYYAADIRTTYGKQIRSLRPGMVVSINGRKVMIDGEDYGNYNTDTIESIRARVGNGPCFQTCVPPYGGSIVIKYGHYM